MPFHSFEFWVFFAVTAVLFCLIPQKYRWYLLLLASLVFIAWALPIGIIYLAAAVLIVWGGSLLIERSASKDAPEFQDQTRRAAVRKKQALLIAELAACFGVLIVLKYYNFFSAIFAGLSHQTPRAIHFLVPLGISFYTFQLTGYAIDVYRGMVPAQRNPFKLMLFTAYFPQMLEGPISRYGDISDRLYEPGPISYQQGKDALLLFVWGLFKKVCIADNLSIYTNHLFGNYRDYSGIMILSAGIAYAIFLYADFSGCIDMARGISAFFGVPLKDNFMRPFFSRSVEEYWRRWHITLSQWFRDYLFYPLLRTKLLQGLGKKLKSQKRKKLAKILPTSIALLILWTITGLWHGANGTYVVYGLYYGILMTLSLVLQTLRSKKRQTEEKPWRKRAEILRTFLLVSGSFLLFASPSLSAAGGMLARLFDIKHFFSLSQMGHAFYAFLDGLGGKGYLVITILSIIALAIHDVLEELGKAPWAWVSKRRKPTKYILAMLVVLFLLFMINRTAGDFTYMQF